MFASGVEAGAAGRHARRVTLAGSSLLQRTQIWPHWPSAGLLVAPPTAT